MKLVMTAIIFFTISQGVFETNIVVSKKLEAKIDKFLKMK